MHRRSILSKAVSTALSALLMLSAGLLSPQTASADDYLKGDINSDGEVNIADLAVMRLYLSGRASISKQGYFNADFDGDEMIDSLDLARLRMYIIDHHRTPEEREEEEFNNRVSTSVAYYATASQTTTTNASLTMQTETMDRLSSVHIEDAFAPVSSPAYYSVSPEEFINAPVKDMYGSLTSQGSGRVCIFYVDFPDCQYNWEPKESRISEMAFADEDPDSPAYPHESISAFYKRASKHRLNISGEAYRYTTKEFKENYEKDIHKVKLIDEVLDSMDRYVDFNSFDGDGDKTIDAIIISVPSSSGEKEWWPCAGMYSGDSEKELDGLNIGHVIVGDAEIQSDDNYSKFVSSYIHELGHCMGMPDYYLYTSTDSEGLHGSAGYDTMDEVYADFSCVSKLMLGWYKRKQIQIYDNSLSQTYTLYNAQTEDGNCIIIPCGDIDSTFRSEFYIIEYTTLDNNNSDIPKMYWWHNYGNGIRILHVDATTDESTWGKVFRYRSGNNAATNFDKGKRFVRVVNDTSTDNLFHVGSIIDNSVWGFGFYDDYGEETIDPQVEISVDKNEGDTYTVTLSRIDSSQRDLYCRGTYNDPGSDTSLPYVNIGMY